MDGHTDPSHPLFCTISTCSLATNHFVKASCVLRAVLAGVVPKKMRPTRGALVPLALCLSCTAAAAAAACTDESSDAACQDVPPLDYVNTTNATRNWFDAVPGPAWFESLLTFLVYGLLFNLTGAFLLICCGLRKRPRKLTPGPRPDQLRFMRSGHGFGLEKLCFKGDRKRWPLAWAAAHGDLTTITRLIEEGADPNEKVTDWFDAQAIGWATSFGQLEAVKLLIKLGADEACVNKSGFTALTDALREGHQPVIDLLQALQARRSSLQSVDDLLEPGMRCKSKDCSLKAHSCPAEWNGDGLYCCGACMGHGPMCHGDRCERMNQAAPEGQKRSLTRRASLDVIREGVRRPSLAIAEPVPSVAPVKKPCRSRAIGMLPFLAHVVPVSLVQVADFASDLIVLGSLPGYYQLIAVRAIGFSCFVGGFAILLIGADPANSFTVWQWVGTIALTPVNLHLVALGLLYASSRDGENKPRADKFNFLFYVSKMLETGLESVPCAADGRFVLALTKSHPYSCIRL